MKKKSRIVSQTFIVRTLNMDYDYRMSEFEIHECLNFYHGLSCADTCVLSNENTQVSHETIIPSEWLQVVSSLAKVSDEWYYLIEKNLEFLALCLKLHSFREMLKHSVINLLKISIEHHFLVSDLIKIPGLAVLVAKKPSVVKLIFKHEKNKIIQILLEYPQLIGFMKRSKKLTKNIVKFPSIIPYILANSEFAEIASNEKTSVFANAYPKLMSFIIENPSVLSQSHEFPVANSIREASAFIFKYSKLASFIEENPTVLLHLYEFPIASSIIEADAYTLVPIVMKYKYFSRDINSGVNVNWVINKYISIFNQTEFDHTSSYLESFLKTHLIRKRNFFL